jgi:prepilin-type N-terminal cleavage/methylation domain-containing protein
MRNYINSLKANEKKGFSLVELIIVIAIMAILVGVVAATVIPYLEKSRKAKDQQQISDINTSLVSAISQSAESAPSFEGKYDDVCLNKTTTTIPSGKQITFGPDLQQLCNDLSQSNYVAKFKSKTFKDTDSIMLYYNSTGADKLTSNLTAYDSSITVSKGTTATFITLDSTKATADKVKIDKNCIAVSE